MRTRSLLLFSLLSAFVAAQTQKYEFTKKPVKSGPFVHLKDEPAEIHTYTRGSAARIFTKGVWVSSGTSSPPAGPSISNISCSQTGMTCHEEMANIVPMGEMFSLSPDSADYVVTRWSETEVVAENRDVEAPLLAGSCHLLGVLKIDLVHKKVYAYQTLTEPVSDSSPSKIVDSKKICEQANNTLWELRAETMFSFSQDAKTVSVTQQQATQSPKNMPEK